MRAGPPGRPAPPRPAPGPWQRRSTSAHPRTLRRAATARRARRRRAARCGHRGRTSRSAPPRSLRGILAVDRQLHRDQALRRVVAVPPAGGETGASGAPGDSGSGSGCGSGFSVVRFLRFGRGLRLMSSSSVRICLWRGGGHQSRRPSSSEGSLGGLDLNPGRPPRRARGSASPPPPPARGCSRPSFSASPKISAARSPRPRTRGGPADRLSHPGRPARRRTAPRSCSDSVVPAGESSGKDVGCLGPYAQVAPPDPAGVGAVRHDPRLERHERLDLSNRGGPEHLDPGRPVSDHHVHAGDGVLHARRREAGATSWVATGSLRWGWPSTASAR